jgi:glycosyltransferase involved in cell wall biosynthesis
MPDSPERNARPRLVLDCTHTFRTGAGTGIQRVVRHFSAGLLRHGDAAGFEVVPASLHASGAWVPIPVAEGRIAFPRAASAREGIVSYDPPSFASFHGIVHRANILGSRAWRRWADAGPNAPGLRRALGAWRRPAPPPGAVTLRSGDILLSLDSSWVYDIRTALDAAGRAGAFRAAVVCDALSLTYPQWFSSGTPPYVAGWLAALLPRLEALVTISEATRDEITSVAASGILGRVPMPPSAAVHLGSDVSGDTGQSAREVVRERIATAGRPAFLTVGTLEPRKNVGYALDIFERLLERGHDVEWHLIGAEGWLTGETVARIMAHPELGDRLVWWQDATDADLAWAYRHASALVAVSLAEGFGLPLVEARQAGLPVFATDIPVFREVLGGEGRYLPLGSAALAAAILEDFLSGALPVPARDKPSNVARSWDERSRELLERVLEMRSAGR